jgi:hypothetical protein
MMGPQQTHRRVVERGKVVPSFFWGEAHEKKKIVVDIFLRFLMKIVGSG